MQREIKFRVWDNAKKIFLPENVWCITNKTDYNSFGIMIEDFENYKAGEFFYYPQQILMQFTGLLDKNGREIYEGDIVTNPFNKNVEIVKYDLFVDDPDYSLGKVLGFCVNDMCGLGYDIEGKMSFEVIGNIYENPELLNQ